VRSTATLGALAALQLLAQIAFQLLVLAGLGVGVRSDVFIAAQAVPIVLSGVLAAGLQSIWQPQLAVADGRGAAWRELHRTAHAQALTAFAIAGAVLAASAVAWVPLLYAGLEAPARHSVLELTPWLLLATAFQGAVAVLTTAERGRDRLVLPELVSLGVGLLALAAVAPVVSAFGIRGAVFLIVVRSVLHWALMVWAVGGSAPAWRAGWRRRDVWRQLRPLVASSAVYKSAPLVDRFWSASAAAGSVTLLGLTQLGMGAVAAVMDRACSMPASPRIARCLAAGDVAGARAEYRRAVLSVAALTAVMLVLLWLMRPLWLDLLALLLSVGREQADVLWVLCVLMAGFVFVAAAGPAVVAVFYALGDTRTPALIGLAGFVVGVGAKSAGFLAGGLTGLVLGTSLYYLLNMVVLVIAVERRLDTLPAARA
jgi:putative peptidoglycan lipid II flippase